MQQRKNVYANTFMELTQGSILNYCVAANVPEGSKVWGCVITPRCDISHCKVPTIHYLPIIDFELWVRHFGADLLYKEYRHDLQSDLKSLLTKVGVKEDLIEAGYSHADIKTVISDNNLPLNRDQKTRANKIIDKYFDAQREKFKEYIKDGNHKKFIERLIGGGLHHFYLLEDWKDPNQYKVMLLRDVRHIDMSIAINYQGGFYPNSFSGEELKMNNIAIVNDDIYCIEAQLESPYLEHLMQAFSYNFTRIGIPDWSKDQLTAKLKDIIANILS